MKKISVSGAVLKNIAYLTMLIDHFFVVVFWELIVRQEAAGNATSVMRQIYQDGRAVGRISFVLFAFLAAESFRHTRSRRNYLLRLGLFAFVSEIPFDLAFSGKIIDLESQNIYLTLFLGVLLLVMWERAGRIGGTAPRGTTPLGGTAPRGRTPLGDTALRGTTPLGDTALRGRTPLGAAVLRCSARLGAVMLCCGAAWLLRSDYQFMGVLLILTLYLTRHREITARVLAAGCVLLLGTWGVNCLNYGGSYTAAFLLQFSTGELYGLFAFLPIALYDGSKGRQLPRAVCYGFYPVHLLVLYGIARLI